LRIGTEWNKLTDPCFLVLVDATLCGMVAMCAGCDVLEPWGAVIIGIFAAVGFYLTEYWMEL